MKHPSVEVVILSSWREANEFPFELLQSFFAEDLQGRLLGVTPVEEDGPKVGARQREIESWVATRSCPIRPWVALDDDASLFEPGCRRLVLCDPSVGLTTAVLKQLTHPLEARIPIRPACGKRWRATSACRR